MEVFAGDGRLLTLDRTLKSGGAGSIHRIVEIPDLVAKLYHPQIERAVYERKVEAMLRLVPDLPDIVEGGVREVQIAWPRFLLRDRQHRFVGFAMPLLDLTTSVELECVLQERQARAQGLPTGLGARVTLAANVASLVAELHRQGHHVVDLKPVNLRFYRRSLHVAMLDCDGFSIQGDGERFPATQFTPDYLAPEFQAQGLSAGGDQAGNEETEDRFALAVVVFQLLNFGIHPFTGRPAFERTPTDIPGRIAHRCYAYGLRANPEMAPNPASGHTAMPKELRLLFDRAFGARGLGRPSADDWVGQLRAYGRRSTGMLVPCRANAAHQHFAGLPCAACARAALLNRAASVVRPQVGAAPWWTAPQWTATRRARRLATQTTYAAPSYAAPSFPAPSFPAPSFPAPSLPLSTPSFKANRWKWFAVLAPAVFGLFFKVCGDMYSEAESARARKWITYPNQKQTTNQMPAVEAVTLASNLDGVLEAAKTSGREAIRRQLYRLPSSHGNHRDQCEAAVASWREKVEWTDGDPAFAHDHLLLYLGQQPASCVDPYSLVLRVVRTMELCRERLHAPAAYPGSGEAECRNHRVIETGVDTLARAILYGQAEEAFAWNGLAEAFVVSDDYEDAEAAYVVSTLLSLRFADERSNFTLLDEQWLKDRAMILAATARVRVSALTGQPVPDDVEKTLHLPWPDEPPPKRPRHHDTQAARAGAAVP